jgi:hypothetical protein
MDDSQLDLFELHFVLPVALAEQLIPEMQTSLYNGHHIPPVRFFHHIRWPTFNLC